ncbi:hypothetical protein J6590_078578 [Homalodisca vitripennis]|nr:hypothetical protein J6590_078578 [Homalodisca vitripennis]
MAFQPCKKKDLSCGRFRKRKLSGGFFQGTRKKEFTNEQVERPLIMISPQRVLDADWCFP